MPKNNNANAEEEILENQTSATENSSEEKEVESPKELTAEEQLATELLALNDKYLRLAAEYDNFRKRSVREKESIYPEAVATTVAKFLPLSDSFERALTAPCTDTEFKKGLDMISLSFADTFSKLGLEVFGEAGDLFDPNMHNAVMHVEQDDIDVSTIVEVFQRGYKIGDRILRYAMVKVAN